MKHKKSYTITAILLIFGFIFTLFIGSIYLTVVNPKQQSFYVTAHSVPWLATQYQH